MDWSPYLIAAVDLVALPLFGFWIFRNPIRGQVRQQLKDFYEQAIKAQHLARTQSFFDFLALIFLGIWLSRWKEGLTSGLLSFPSDFYLSMLDASLFCHFVSGITKSDFFLKFFIQTPLNSSRKVLIQYFFAITIGAFLLMLPISHQEGRFVGLLDAFFISVSALCVTGLTTINVADTLSTFGLSVLLLLIQLGGLGIVIIITAFSFARYRRVTYNDASTAHELYGVPNFAHVPDFLLRVFGLSLLFEVIGALVIYFSLDPRLQGREFHALFHSVSSFCNAGFSSFSANLENAPMSGVGYSTICMLIILGGLGFPVLFEILANPAKIFRGRLSAHARMTFNMTLFLLVGGTLLFWLFASLHSQDLKHNWSLISEALFYSVVSRTAGFNEIPVNQLGVAVQILIILLMIVGAGPLSTGGGIKTTTLGVLLATGISFLKGRKGVQVFHREVPYPIVIRAVSVVFFYFILSIFSILLLIATEDLEPLEISFEIISALSTVGLSMNVTEKFSVFGKVWLMFLMLAGRLGLVSILYAGIGNVKESRYRYPEGQFYVG